MKSLVNASRSLQRTLKDLKDYQRKHDLYQMQSDKLLAEQVPHEVKIAQHLAYEQLKMREKSAEMGKLFHSDTSFSVSWLSFMPVLHDQSEAWLGL